MIGIPVLLVASNGQISTDNVNCSPCIRATVIGPQGNVDVICLLDSGATRLYAEPALAAVTGMPVIGVDTAYAVGAAHETPIHSCTILIEGIAPMIADIQAVPLKSAGKPYDMILGRSFLTLFDFGFSPETGWHLRTAHSARVAAQDHHH